MDASTRATEVVNIESSDDSDFEQDLVYSDDESDDMAQCAPEAKATAKYRIIDADVLRKCQAEVIDGVVSMLACTSSEAMVLLRHFRWNSDAVMESIAVNDREEVFRLAGAHSSSCPATASQAMSGEQACGICMDDIAQEDQMRMDCGHSFCADCWLRHIQIKIAEGQSCSIPCMAFKCGAICGDSIVTDLLGKRDESALQKYEQSRLDSYIEDNNHVHWCPSVPNCGRAVQMLDDEYCQPLCPCGLHFCFKCNLEPHSPCTCEMWAAWKEKEQGDTETKHWLQANTKPCPKCAVPVEKDGGCNLVMCRSCRQAFCWLCGAKTGVQHTWTSIEGHTCGSWREEMDNKIEDSKLKHERYMHYYKHYKAHMSSTVSENKANAIAAMIPVLILEDVSGLVDYSFLENGNSILLECRRVLANSYVFAFFTFGNEMFSEDIALEESRLLKELFEDTQQTLYATAEALSMVMRDVVRELEARIRVATGCDEDPDDPDASNASVASASNTASKRQKIAEMDPAKEQATRLEIINLTNSIDMRVSKLFTLIENDILARVHTRNAQIAPRSPMIKINQA